VPGKTRLIGLVAGKASPFTLAPDGLTVALKGRGKLSAVVKNPKRLLLDVPRKTANPTTRMPALVDASTESGKTLASASASGFGCTTCHAIGDQKPTAAFEVQGVNLLLSAARLRKDDYFRWMANPRSITPATKMPKYAEGNLSQRTDLLDGDAHKQFEAIWNYLHQK
jgi:hypothetical protein